MRTDEEEAKPEPHTLHIKWRGIPPELRPEIAKFLEAGLLDRLQIAIAPLLIGDGPQGLTLASASACLSKAIRPEMRAFSLGSDVVFDCEMTS